MSKKYGRNMDIFLLSVGVFFGLTGLLFLALLWSNPLSAVPTSPFTIEALRVHIAYVCMIVTGGIFIFRSFHPQKLRALSIGLALLSCLLVVTLFI